MHYIILKSSSIYKSDLNCHKCDVIRLITFSEDKFLYILSISFNKGILIQYTEIKVLILKSSLRWQNTTDKKENAENSD